MKHYIIIILLLKSCFYLNAQKVIYESELSYDIKNIKYSIDENFNLTLYLQEKFFLKKPIFKKILIYDNDNFIDIKNEYEFSEIFTNKELFFLQKAKPALIGFNYDNFVILKNEKNNLYEKVNYNFKLSEFYGAVNEHNKKLMINKDFIYNVVTRKKPYHSSDNRIEKEELSLFKYHFSNKEKEYIDIVKPNILRLKNDTLFKPKVIGYYYEKNDENSFHIITKAISKDFLNAKVYRTIYDLNGKLIEEKTYNISPINGYFHYCTIMETPLNLRNAETGNGIIEPTYDLDVNSHFRDKETGDFYFFGITSDDKNRPLGFYVYKFDIQDKLVWKKFYPIDDSNVFNKKYNWWNELSLLSFNYNKNEIVFNVKAAKNYTDNTHHIFKISRNNGDIEKYYSLSTHRKTQFTSYENGNFELGNKMYCTEAFLVAKSLDSRIENYYKTINSKNKLNFKAAITPKGIFVFETDEKKYYKVLFFE